MLRPQALNSNPSRRIEPNIGTYATREPLDNINNSAEDANRHGSHVNDTRHFVHFGTSLGSSSTTTFNSSNSNVTHLSEYSCGEPSRPSLANLRGLLEENGQYVGFEVDPRTSERRQYLTKHDLKQFWTNNYGLSHALEAAIREALRANRLDYDEEYYAFSNFQRVACIMIWTDQNQLFSILPQLVAQASNDFTDSKLPWSDSLQQKALRWLGSYTTQFFENQYLFLDPIDIGLHRDHFPDFGPSIPLPLVPCLAGRYTGVALNGTIIKSVWVKKSHLHPQRTLSSEMTRKPLSHLDSVCIAVKVTGEDGSIDPETRSNGQVARRLRDHENIVSFIDVLQRGNDLYFFFLNPCQGDLETFMTSRHQSPRYHQPSGQVILHNLLRSYSGLVDGLCYLLRQDKNVELSLSGHNVLVYDCNDLPFGRWKLFDFEIVTDPRSKQQLRGGPAATLFNGEVLETMADASLNNAFQQALAPPSQTYGNLHAGGNSSNVMGNVIHVHFYSNSSLPRSDAHQNQGIDPNQALMSTNNAISHNPYRAPELDLDIRSSQDKTLAWSMGCILVDMIALAQCLSRSSCVQDDRTCRRHFRYSLERPAFFTIETIQRQDSPSENPQPDVRRHHAVQALLDLTKAQDPSFQPCVNLTEQLIEIQHHERWSLSELKYHLPKLLDEPEDVTMREEIPTAPVIQARGTDVIRPISVLEEESMGSIHAARTPLVGHDTEPGNQWQLIIASDYTMLRHKIDRDRYFIQSNGQELNIGASASIFPVSGNWNWKAFRLSGPYGVLYASNEDDTMIQSAFDWFVFNIQTRNKYEVPVEHRPNDALSAVVPAHTGLLAFVFQHSIWLTPLDGNVAEAVTPSSSRDYEIAQVTFGKIKEEMFVFLEENDRTHIVQGWTVGPFRRPNLFCSIEIPITDPHLKLSNVRLLPSNHESLCFLLHGRDLTSILVQQGRQHSHLSVILDAPLMATNQYPSYAMNNSFMLFLFGKDKRIRMTVYFLRLVHSQCRVQHVGSAKLNISRSMKWALVRSRSDDPKRFDIYGQDVDGYEQQLVVRLVQMENGRFDVKQEVSEVRVSRLESQDLAIREPESTGRRPSFLQKLGIRRSS